MKRILLKISGELLSADGLAISPEQGKSLAQIITIIKQQDIELVIVLGWGNIYRGSNLIQAGVNPADSHNMSMLSTVFNAVSLKNFLEAEGCSVKVLDALHVEFLEAYTSVKAKEYLNDGNVVICSSGTGVPFFTTDTGWVLRAIETGCEAMIKVTKVDGVYDSDPMKNPQAQKFDTISYDSFISQDLKVLDQTAVIMARDNALPVYVMKMNDSQDVMDILAGKKWGTKISH